MDGIAVTTSITNNNRLVYSLGYGLGYGLDHGLGYRYDSSHSLVNYYFRHYILFELLSLKFRGRYDRPVSVLLSAFPVCCALSTQTACNSCGL